MDDEPRKIAGSLKPLVSRVNAVCLPGTKSMVLLTRTGADGLIAGASDRFSGETVLLRFVGLLLGRRLSCGGR
jgi:hypothetical protein